MAANEQRWSCVSSDGVGVCKERMGGMGWLALRTEAHLCVGSREQSVSVARAEERAATARGIARTTRTGREQRTVVLESVDGELFVRGVGLSKPLLPEGVCEGEIHKQGGQERGGVGGHCHSPLQISSGIHGSLHTTAVRAPARVEVLQAETRPQILAATPKKEVCQEIGFQTYDCNDPPANVAPSFSSLLSGSYLFVRFRRSGTPRISIAPARAPSSPLRCNQKQEDKPQSPSKYSVVPRALLPRKRCPPRTPQPG